MVLWLFWCRSTYATMVDKVLNYVCCAFTGCFMPTKIDDLPATNDTILRILSKVKLRYCLLMNRNSNKRRGALRILTQSSQCLASGHRNLFHIGTGENSYPGLAIFSSRPAVLGDCNRQNRQNWGVMRIHVWRVLDQIQCVTSPYSSLHFAASKRTTNLKYQMLHPTLYWNNLKIATWK